MYRNNYKIKVDQYIIEESGNFIYKRYGKYY